MLVRLVLSALAGCILWLSSPAYARDEPLTVSVQYNAPTQCPGEEAFWAALTHRTRRVARVEVGAARVLLRVDLRATRTGVLGRLDIVQEGFATEPRYVEADDCVGVLQALALTAALGIDPGALTRPPSEIEAPVFEAPPRDPPSAVPTAPLAWHTTLNVSAIAALPVDLQFSWGLAAALSFRSDPRGSWSPAIHVGAALTRSDLVNDDAVARFALYTASVSGCPTRVVEESFEMRPCLVTQLGLLDAQGQNVSDPNGTRRTWAAVGPSLELELGLSSSLRAQLSVAGLAPVTSQAYTFGEEPNEIARTPVVIPWIGLGLVNTL